MESSELSQKVIVLTDRSEGYGPELLRLGLTPHYAPSVDYLLHSLDNSARGLVLEVGKVMRAPEPGRDQLFQLSKVFPVLRVLRRGPEHALVYLDEAESFSAQVQVFTPRHVRQCGRVPVLLGGLLAAEDDVDFASPVRANILDLSGGGGLVSSAGDFSFGETVRLRIEDMEDRTPILSTIRWRKAEKRTSSRIGLGLNFLSIRPGQVRELLTRFLAPLGGLAGAQA